MTISFDVLAKPRGKGRPRFTRKGHAYTPAQTRQYERVVAMVALAARQEWEHENAVSWPMKARRGYKLSCEVTGAHGNTDADNVLKLCADSIQGVLYENDRQLREVHAVKVTGGVPRLRVTVETLP